MQPVVVAQLVGNCLPILSAFAAVPRIGARAVGGAPKATSTFRLLRLEYEGARVRPVGGGYHVRLREADRISVARVNRDEVNVGGLQLVLSPRRLVDHIRIASVAVSIAKELLANRGLIIVAHVAVVREHDAEERAEPIDGRVGAGRVGGRGRASWSPGTASLTAGFAKVRTADHEFMGEPPKSPAHAKKCWLPYWTMPLHSLSAAHSTLASPSPERCDHREDEPSNALYEPQ
eukprot:scaffold46467_cov70-Phaeocystis_antarctica.AAC.1